MCGLERELQRYRLQEDAACLCVVADVSAWLRLSSAAGKISGTAEKKKKKVWNECLPRQLGSRVEGKWAMVQPASLFTARF